MDGLSLWPNTCSKSETKTLELYITTLYSTLTSTSMTNNSNIMKLHLISMDLADNADFKSSVYIQIHLKITP